MVNNPNESKLSTDPIPPGDPVSKEIQTQEPDAKKTESVLVSINWGAVLTTLITSGIFGRLLSLAILVATETYEQKRIAREKEEAYEMDIQKFKEIVDKAMIVMITGAKRESQQAQQVEDQIDHDITGGDPSDSRGSR